MQLPLTIIYILTMLVLPYSLFATTNISLTQEERNWIKSNTVKVGVEQWLPVVFSNDGKDIDGISGDFTKKLIEKTGLKIEVINDNWDKLLRDFKNKKIDILPATYYNERRAEFGLFSDGYFKMKDAIYLKKSNKTIKSLKDLEGKTLAIPRGYGTIDKIQKKFPKIKLVFTRDLDDSINRVLNGRVFAFYEGQIAAEAKINDELIKGLKSISVITFKAPTLHYFSKIDKPILASIIQKGLKSFSYKEKNDIIFKWVSSNNKVILTELEENYLSKKEIIKYVYDPHRQPFEYVNDLDKHSGVTSNILDIISQKSSLKFESTVTKSWEESISLIKDKKADMLTFVIENEDRQKYLNFTNKTLFKIPIVFVTNKDDENIYENIKYDLKDKKIGIVKARAIHKKLLKKFPDFHFMKLDSVNQGFEKLASGKIDMLAINKSTAKYYIQAKGFDNAKIAIVTDIFFEFKMALQKYLPNEVLSILNKSLDSLSDKEINDIYNNNVNLKIAKTTDWTLVGQVTAGILLVFILILISNYKLKSKIKEKTADLEEQKNKLLSLISSFDKNVIFTSTDLKGIITSASEAFCNISGYKKEELIGQPQSIVRHNDVSKELFKDLWKTIKAGKNWIGEIKNLKKDGGFYWVKAIVSPEFDSKGVIIGYSAIRHDITSKKEVEELTTNLEKKIALQTKDIKKQLRVVKMGERKQTELMEVLHIAKKEVEAIQKHTRESIEYASLIQSALIPDKKIFENYFSDYLAIWHPKDIVGGDIYLFEELRNKDECLLMIIDCTGHGVPGAFVTMLVKAIERQIVAKINNDLTIDVSPAWILFYFNKKMKILLKQENADSISNAGFDGGIIYFNKKEQILKFSGAETSLFYIEDEELKTIKGSRHSVGYKKSNPNFKFKEHKIKVKKGMQFYCLTDGYLDQNGGEKGFPFGKKRFQDLIKEHHKESMIKQQDILLDTIREYQNDNERNDDITLIGLEV